MTMRSKFLDSNGLLSRRGALATRRFFAEGDWVTIQDDLTLSGWDSMQRNIIYTQMCHGLSLRAAIRRVTNKLGSCPINAKIFFQN